MFNTIKRLFNEGIRYLTLPAFDFSDLNKDFYLEGNRDMRPALNRAFIDDDNNLFVNGEFVGSYSRRRDARRGAARRGLSVA